MDRRSSLFASQSVTKNISYMMHWHQDVVFLKWPVSKHYTLTKGIHVYKSRTCTLNLALIYFLLICLWLPYWVNYGRKYELCLTFYKYPSHSVLLQHFMIKRSNALAPIDHLAVSCSCNGGWDMIYIDQITTIFSRVFIFKLDSFNSRRQ